MANLNVEPVQVRPCAERTKEVAQKLNALAGEVDSIRGNLRFKIAGREQIAARLRDISEKIVREEAVTRSMGDALDRILSQYERAESANLARLAPDSVDNAGGSASSGGGGAGGSGGGNAYRVDSILFDNDGSYGGDQGHMENVYNWNPIKCWELLKYLREYYPHTSFQVFRKGLQRKV